MKLIGMNKHVSLQDHREVVLGIFEREPDTPVLLGVEGKASPHLTPDMREAVQVFQEEVNCEWVDLDETYKGQ